MGNIGAMVEWISDERRYEIGSIMKSKTAEVYDDEFPLRMEPRGDDSLIKFEGFVDKLGPAIDMTHSEAEKQAVSGSRETEEEVEYVLREIIGTKMKGRKQHYIVLWDTKEVSLEPKDGLHIDSIKAYVSRVEQAAATV